MPHVLAAGLRHHRVEPGPGVDVAARQSSAAVRMLLHQDGNDVLVAHAVGLQRTHQENVRVGAAHHRHALAAQVLHLVDRTVARGDQRGPFRP
jgi:hypothetical protein